MEANRKAREEELKNLGSLDSRDWRSVLERERKQSGRERELDILRSGSNISSGSAPRSQISAFNTDLFGVGGQNFSLDDMTNRAKDLARFRLGLDTEQARTFRGLREEEAQADFGRDLQRLQSEQSARIREIQETFGGQERLTNLTQGALTGRLEKELSNRLEQQTRSNAQANLAANRAIGLASRRLGG